MGQGQLTEIFSDQEKYLLRSRKNRSLFSQGRLLARRLVYLVTEKERNVATQLRRRLFITASRVESHGKRMVIGRLAPASTRGMCFRLVFPHEFPLLRLHPRFHGIIFHIAYTPKNLIGRIQVHEPTAGHPRTWYSTVRLAICQTADVDFRPITAVSPHV